MPDTIVHCRWKPGRENFISGVPDGNGISNLKNLLKDLGNGDDGAMHDLVEEIYPDLKRLAHFQLAKERIGFPLSTTEVVHEAFLRLSSKDGSWNDESHFMRAAARVMRHLLVDFARQRNAEKRGGGLEPVTLQDKHELSDEHNLAVLELDAELKRISEIDPHLESVIECRYFAGLTVKQTAATLNLSVRTVERHWQRARGYILHALEPQGD